MATAVERALKRLQVVAAAPDAPRLRTLEKIAKHTPIPVEADGSPWGNFLSHMNRALRTYMDDINEVMESQDLETLPDILSDAMQDLLDSLADEFGYENESEDGGGYEDGEEADDSQPEGSPAAGAQGAGAGTTVIE